MLALKRERVEQLTTGDISHGTENNANLPPSVAREGGQEHYQMFLFKGCSVVIWKIKNVLCYRCSSLLLGIIHHDRFCWKLH